MSHRHSSLFAVGLLAFIFERIAVHSKICSHGRGNWETPMQNSAKSPINTDNVRYLKVSIGCTKSRPLLLDNTLALTKKMRRPAASGKQAAIINHTPLYYPVASLSMVVGRLWIAGFWIGCMIW
eukprot:scaffold5504_cov53-Cyclotella_meneghiniana.AAC.3